MGLYTQKNKRVVFVLGPVSLINSLTSGKKKTPSARSLSRGDYARTQRPAQAIGLLSQEIFLVQKHPVKRGDTRFTSSTLVTTYVHVQSAHAPHASRPTL